LCIKFLKRELRSLLGLSTLVIIGLRPFFDCHIKLTRIFSTLDSNKYITMKKIFILLFALVPLLSFGQAEDEMRLIGTQIFSGKSPISVGIAKNLSMAKSPEAYLHFKKASQIRGWNVVWWIAGGYEVIAGGVSLGQGSPIAFLDVALGGVLIGITPSRENKRKFYVMQGVNTYNKSLKID